MTDGPGKQPDDCPVLADADGTDRPSAASCDDSIQTLCSFGRQPSSNMVLSGLSVLDMLDLAVGDCMSTCCITTFLGLLHRDKSWTQPDTREQMNTAVSRVSSVSFLVEAAHRNPIKSQVIAVTTFFCIVYNQKRRNKNQSPALGIIAPGRVTPTVSRGTGYLSWHLRAPSAEQVLLLAAAMEMPTELNGANREMWKEHHGCCSASSSLQLSAHSEPRVYQLNCQVAGSGANSVMDLSL
ncbi:hypothetical protein NEUTE2DRAFT_70817 [Neurospora tetrasperma FGSC 2509]|nr:hypothetical protein NEUTE2DRAFT_70817 [Neurospora tetrasperma FGSC 2509]